MSALTPFHADIKNILEQAICYTVCSKLSWSHNRLIMRVDDTKARAYCHAASDHFRGVTKMLERDSGLKCEVDHVRGFSTRCVENPLESFTIDAISQFAPTSHQHREDITHGSHS
jgi:hypothetical protein